MGVNNVCGRNKNISNGLVKMTATILRLNLLLVNCWYIWCGTVSQPMTGKFLLQFSEFHSDSSIRYKITLFENYIHKCYKTKRILISFNCFSECI